MLRHTPALAVLVATCPGDLCQDSPRSAASGRANATVVTRCLNWCLNIDLLLIS